MLEDSSHIRNWLTDKEGFLELANFFIKKATEEDDSDGLDVGDLALMRSGLETLAQRNTHLVFLCSQSPIEASFLNSLALCFIRNCLPLVVVPKMSDAPQMIADLRNQLSDLRKLATWYEQRDPSYANLSQYLDAETRRGALPAEERPGLEELILLYEQLNFRTACHISLQPVLTDVLINGKPIRADMLCWIPENKQCKLVVECDGFQFHSCKEVFVRDRRKDRAMKAAGYEVFRFAGSEIYHDPPSAANELFDYLLRFKQLGTLTED
jgi:hypothetical protein